MTRRLSALAAILAVCGSLTLLCAGPASAHAVRLATDPAPDATMTVGPQRVSATFNERLQTTFAAVTVVGPDQKLWSDGDPRIEGAIASVGVRPLGPAGTYTVNYRVTSADGHVVNGSWSFRLTVAGTGTPGPSVTSDGGEGAVPMWPFVVAAVAIVGAGGWWAARRRA